MGNLATLYTDAQAVIITRYNSDFVTQPSVLLMTDAASTRERAPARAGKPESLQSRLLEQSDGKRLDSITLGGAIGSDPAIATVGALDRPEDHKR
jgi:hypothetical protein